MKDDNRLVISNLTIKERRDFFSSVHSQRRWVYNIWYLRSMSQLVCFHFSFDYYLQHHRHFRQKQQMTIFALLKEAHKWFFVFWCCYCGFFFFVSFYFLIKNHAPFAHTVVEVIFNRKHEKDIILNTSNAIKTSSLFDGKSCGFYEAKSKSSFCKMSHTKRY